MRTILVNPLVARRTIPRGHRVSGMVVRRKRRMSNPRRRRRHHHNPPALMMMANGHRRRRRHVRRRNGMILPNRRHRRRRNPSLNLISSLKTAAFGLAGGGAGYVLNKYLVSGIATTSQQGVWIRGGLRLVAGAAAALFLPNMFGSAFNGAMGYGTAIEIDQWWQARSTATPTPTALDLHDLEAQLDDVLD